MYTAHRDPRTIRARILKAIDLPTEVRLSIVQRPGGFTARFNVSSP
jgi:hypothetical protein